MIEQITQAMSEPGWWGIATAVCVGLTVAVGVISIMFEVFTIIFILTPSDKDDKWLAKVKRYWLQIKPLMEWFHVKTPVMLILDKVLQRAKKIRETIEEAKKAKAKKKAKKAKKAKAKAKAKGEKQAPKSVID